MQYVIVGGGGRAFISTEMPDIKRGDLMVGLLHPGCFCSAVSLLVPP